jgi:CheY-like chemotaxis protein
MEHDSALILLVEDNPDHAELVIRNLAEHRVANRVIHLTNGQAALDYLLRRGEYADQARSPRPRLILLDLRLPRVDGLEVLRVLKSSALLCSIPVVVLTTSNAEQDALEAYRRHVNSYLVKPLGFEAFRQLIDDLGAYWLARNKAPVLDERAAEGPDSNDPYPT